MSRRLGRPEQEELSGFVNALAAAAGYATTTEWARESGYSYPNLVDLRNGRSACDGFTLLRLIRAAAARMELEPSLLAAAAAEASAEADGEEWLRQRLNDISEGLARALELLEDGQGQSGDGRSRRSK